MNNKIIQVILTTSFVYIFTKNPEEDAKKLIELYHDENYKGVSLGYEEPEFLNFRFLGKEYPCIRLWFDNDDIPEYYYQYLGGANAN